MHRLYSTLAGAFTVLAALTLPSPTPAAACGGMFCGNSTPVDQQAEKIVFVVDRDANTTRMIVEITYQGSAPDFAWVLPLGTAEVLAESLETFPQGAMDLLAQNTSVIASQAACPSRAPPFSFADPGPAVDASSAADAGLAPAPPRVEVLVREEVGPFDVAVIRSEFPDALVTWLRDNDFRLTDPMIPFLELYTDEAEGQATFMALRLQPDAKVSQIQPLSFTLPGTSPNIPLRMTAIAAEPEMGILTFVLGDRNYEPANQPSLTIPDTAIRAFFGQNNWTALVAQAVDDAGGQGWVTEFAGPADPLQRAFQNQAENTRAILDADAEGGGEDAGFLVMPDLTPELREQFEDQLASQEAAAELLRGAARLTRMYTRLSADEMTVDPIFRRGGTEDVSRTRRNPNPPYWCDTEMFGGSACDFMTCGAGGACFETQDNRGTVRAACACPSGTVARATMDPAGDPTVICVDDTSYLNPGDRETPDATPLPDPCATYSGCGDRGTCVAHNLTPTCRCDEGFVATGRIDDDGNRTVRCVTPRTSEPHEVLRQRLIDDPPAVDDMPIGSISPDAGATTVETPEIGCSASGDARGGILLFLLLVGLGLRGHPGGGSRGARE